MTPDRVTRRYVASGEPGPPRQHVTRFRLRGAAGSRDATRTYQRVMRYLAPAAPVAPAAQAAAVT